MKQIIKDLIKIISKDIKTPHLGRWKIEKMDTPQMNSKIDLSNHDHCGACGKYIKKEKEKGKGK
jgi:hypothetical protein